MSDYIADTNESLEPLQDPDINTDTTASSCLDVYKESDSDATVDTCCIDDLSEPFSFRVAKSESYNSTYRLAPNSNAVFNSNNTFDKPFLPHSPSLTYSPSHTVPMISCSSISGDETVLQEGTVRGFDNAGNDSDDDSCKDETGGHHGNLLTHHSSIPQHSLPNSPRYKSLSAAVNTSLTPQTSAGTSHVGLKHEGKIGESAGRINSKKMSFMFPKSSSKGDYLIGDGYSLAERRSILLDVPNGRNELVMAAYSTQSIPKLYPIVGLRKELPGIALPPPIPLDLPKIDFSRKVTSIISHQQVIRKQPIKAGYGLGKVLSVVSSQRPQSMASGCQQQQAPLSQSIDFSDPVGIISRAAVFLTAGDYGTMIRLLEILDKHLVLPEDIDLAKEFGQGLAHYIPDSVTHLLPFYPLMNKENWQFFGDKYRIRIVPSFLSLLVMSMTSNPVVEVPGDKSDFLIVGNPTIPPFMYDSIQWNLGRLPYAEKETISVANIIGTVPVLREQATKRSVLYRLRSAKVIHLATHGSASTMFLAFTSSFPVSKSGLAEKEQILIFPGEIETLNISPALVVLSSCDSARGQVKAEGVIGMARAFLLAGAHSVLVSLWGVPDESTNIFMQYFYEFPFNGLPSLEALQRSMQCLRCFLKYSHYVHWSGFQIIGKEVTFHKDPHAHFTIQKMFEEISLFFPRQCGKSIEESLPGLRNLGVQVCFSLLFLIYTVNTNLMSHISVGTSRVGLKHEGKMREAAAKPNSTVMGFMLPKSPAMYSSKGDYLIGDSYSLPEREPILLDVPNGCNELIMAAYSTQSILKLYPVVGLCKELLEIVLPPSITLDLPKINFSRELINIAPHQQVVGEHAIKTDCSLGTIQRVVLLQRPQSIASGYQQQQQTPLSQSMNCSDPVNTVRGFDDGSDSSSDDEISNNQTSASHQPVVRMQPNTTNFDLGMVPGLLTNTNVQLLRSNHLQQYHSPFNKSMNFSDPVNIVNKAAGFLHAEDYGGMISFLEIYKRSVLPEDIDMAREFGLGLAHYKHLHYRSAKFHFNALFEKSKNYGSPGNQALASIYLGEIEMSWGKYKDAEKHFTLAVTYYSSDNVAEKFQQTILTKSAVLVKKGQCHRSLSQIKEAISTFKMAKEEAELVQEQTRGSKLKTAKEDELSSLFELGNIHQSLGDRERSSDYYEKSLKLAGELGDHVSVGRAHGNLGNAKLELDQKDEALHHLKKAFEISEKYEDNPLAIGRVSFNLGSAYQAINDLPKAKEHYKIALQYNIHGNDLDSQSYICDHIANINRLLKEPAEAVHYYTKALRLSTDKNTKITRYHNRGCARFEVAECILQGKKPKELVTATTPDPTYGRLTIKLTDDVITTDPQETELNSQPVSKQEESIKTLPIIVDGKTYDGVTNVEIIQLTEALPFLEAAKSDFHEAIELHEQSIQNSKDSHEASSSRSFYKIQETLVELGKLRQRLLKLGVMDTVATEPQEFKEALVYGEQARARTLGELLQKKKEMYSDLFSVSTPLKLQDIYRAVQLQKVPVVFISYCLSKLLMWILVSVKDEVVMKCQSIDLKEEELENSSLELYLKDNLLQFDFLSKDDIHMFRPCSYEQESPFTVLYDVIGVKIIEGLKSVGFSEGTECIIIPDSVIHSIPFSSLMNKHNSQCFGDKYQIRIVPSFLSLLVMSMTSNPVVEVPGDKSDFLIVGNPTIPPFMYDSTQWNLPRLPYAEKETISVANIIGTVPVLREQATKQSVLYRLRSAKVIHLATHGSPKFLPFASSFPVSKSGLAEKEHILIFPEDIETLNISPALVVLSACNLARGQVKAEGIIGAFLLAGAHSVVAKLWRAPDESTKIFMQFFYRFLINGLSSLEALQRSMQCLRCFLKYSNYVHWSGFHIFGKEITFHRNLHAHFPIQKMLGEVSIFHRQQHVKSIEESLLGVKNKIFTDVQVCLFTMIYKLWLHVKGNKILLVGVSSRLHPHL